MKTRLFLPCLALAGLLLGACRSARPLLPTGTIRYHDSPPRPPTPPQAGPRFPVLPKQRG